MMRKKSGLLERIKNYKKLREEKERITREYQSACDRVTALEDDKVKIGNMVKEKARQSIDAIIERQVADIKKRIDAYEQKKRRTRASAISILEDLQTVRGAIEAYRVVSEDLYRTVKRSMDEHYAYVESNSETFKRRVLESPNS